MVSGLTTPRSTQPARMTMWLPCWWPGWRLSSTTARLLPIIVNGSGVVIRAV